MQGLRCGGFSCCRGQALGRATCSGCGTWAQWLRHVGSVAAVPGLWSTVVVAHGLSCSTAGGIFLDQGSDSCLLHWHADSLPLSYEGSPTNVFLID